MTDSLFRQEALDATRHKLMGTVSLYSPPWRWLMIAVATATTLAVVAFLVFGTYTKRERVAGQLLPAKGLLTVAPPLMGTVTDTRVREGQIVAAGAELMAVSAEVATELGSTRERVGEQLRLQRARLEADLASQSQLRDEANRGLRARAAALNDQLAQIALQKTQRARQIELAQRQLGKLQSMREQGYASNSQVEQQEAALLDAQARLQDLARQRLDVEQQLDQLRQQLRELPLNTRNQQNDIERKLADVDQSIAENEARRAVILRAPQASVVAALLAKPGQVVNAGQSVVSLLPQGAQLEAQLMVPSRAIGFVRPGARVVLRYQAYPFQKFGQQFGRVAEVSRTALSPQEVANLTGQTNVPEQLYRVVVALDRQDIDAYGKREALRPGMALEADVLIDKRRLIEWVLEPLYALGRRASA
ncbi:HlyD family secretion protein [Burkholderia stagnalis]|uniref:HlyD family efflux transporter periplasmic adaptor subunit n=1 Tax=Burkholderia stagnalis TaxID=1503054 RepID=A0ABX9YBL7_9BURK|nr:HlyD family efflux transporter periplasmic adaptor subunit [Burkholderia stagnalis]RQQ44413.1 HlyD family efflux transporter periplasmic adaptor subunit [Burkholderia stagnalis]RQQ57922.1 HlyD family efflux transporter periplasmic adaptor subunit [Burkholderia stagnalis]RQQ58059.1 HlyD family efflux transporter periplasmic adaptor subunit [Burkholderia stagnalis]RQQ71406.1 HlyD family efflux transporter periplasmic adaptor subunit [Burkholderia stagnalis]RQQ78347.1 HlyD family efflux transp